MSENGQWTMPEVELGELVLFTRRPNNPDWVLGRCRKVTPKAINVTIEGTPNLFRGVRHQDDPEIKENPLVIEGSGVFVQAPTTIRLNKALATQDAQQAFLERLALEVEQLRQKVETCQPKGKSLRGSASASKSGTSAT